MLDSTTLPDLGITTDTSGAGGLAEIIAGGPKQPVAAMTGRRKAAIIVRLLLAEGTRLPLSALPDHVQAALTEQMGMMRLIDRATMRHVAQEFLAEIEAVGLTFPGGIDGAISLLDGQISANAANRLRRMTGSMIKADPWERIARQEPERLLTILQGQSVEVGALMLGKLPVDRAAELLERMPGARARRIAATMPTIGEIDHETVQRIGTALIGLLEDRPAAALDGAPDERMGAILNSSPATTRRDVLDALDQDDPDFAAEVRRRIFTFAHLPRRLPADSVAIALRRLDLSTMVRALGHARATGGDEGEAAEFLLANVTPRMADNLRGQIEEQPPVTAREGEAAMAAVVEAIRTLEREGSVALKPPQA